MVGRVQIDRFAVKNFRSIKECDVELAPLTFFIGANASGKSNFIDALLFLASAVRESLDKAIAHRGGIHSILYRPTSLPATSRFDVYISATNGVRCEFHLELQIAKDWSVSVVREECQITNASGEQHYYVVEDGTVRGSAAIFPAVSADRIFLSNASGLPEFRFLFDFMTGLALTQPTPTGIHDLLQTLNRWTRSLNSGSEERGLAVRFRNLAKNQPDRLEIIQQYLRAIAPPFDRVEVTEANDTLWLRFVDKSPSGDLIPFYLSQTSDGLVNSAEMLLELFELPAEGQPVSPVIIEEPEALLHPGAIQVIRDSFLEVSKIRQVLVTTHSPDLLDDPEIPAEWIRTVQRNENGTHIDVLDAGTKSVIQDQLYTPGQLLRQGGLILNIRCHPQV